MCSSYFVYTPDMSIMKRDNRERLSGIKDVHILSQFLHVLEIEPGIL